MRKRRFVLTMVVAVTVLAVVLLAGCPDVRVETDGMAHNLEAAALAGNSIGNVRVELDLNDDDVANYLKDGKGSVTAALYTTAASRSAGSGSGYTVMVPGSEQKFTDPATVIYTANGMTVPHGDYEVKVTTSSTSVAADTSVAIRIPVSVGNKQLTVGTAGVTQVYFTPPQPTDFFTSFTKEHETDMTYEGTMEWSQVTWTDSTDSSVQIDGKQNGFELEILKWQNGKMPENDTEWNERANAGGITYTLTQDNYTPKDSPVVEKLEGGLDKDSTGIRLKLKREDNKYYAMRVRAVNYVSSSEWLYFPYLAMPAPGVNKVTTQNAGDSEIKTTGTTWEGQETNKRWNATFEMEVPKYDFNTFHFEWQRMGQKGGNTQTAGDRIRYPDDFNSDEKWEEQEAQQFIGGNKKQLTKAEASSCVLPGFVEKTPFMVRVCVEITGVGKSAWCYYGDVVKSKDDTTNYNRPTP